MLEQGLTFNKQVLAKFTSGITSCFTLFSGGKKSFFFFKTVEKYFFGSLESDLSYQISKEIMTALSHMLHILKISLDVLYAIKKVGNICSGLLLN